MQNLRPHLARGEGRFVMRSKMIFMLSAVAIAVLFFAGSLILLRLGQHLGCGIASGAAARSSEG